MHNIRIMTFILLYIFIIDVFHILSTLTLGFLRVKSHPKPLETQHKIVVLSKIVVHLDKEHMSVLL